jgi:hypothetical protein
MIPDVNKLTRSNIVKRIYKLNMEEMLATWQSIMDVSANIPPNDRKFELADLLTNFVIPGFQTYQGISIANIIEQRENANLTGGFSVGSEYKVLTPDMLKLMKSIQRRMKKAATAKK